MTSVLDADCSASVGPTLTALDSSLTIANVVIAATTFAQTQASGFSLSVPALGATWNAPTSPYVLGIEFEYTPTSYSGSTKLTAPQQGGATSWITTDGIVSEGVYSVRWRAVGPVLARGDWSTPVSITIDTLPILTGDLAAFLWSIKVNLWRFAVFTYLGTASANLSFTAFGEQGRAILMPGGDASARAQVLGRQAGSSDFGYAYDFQFTAKVDSGTATLRGRWRDISNAAITGIADQTWAITTTPTTFTWENIASSDPDFFAGPPNTSHFEFYVNNTTDIPAGRVVSITDIQIQLDNFWDPHAITTPWRPAPDDDDLTNHAALLATLYQADLAAKKNQRVMVGPEGQGTVIAPLGPSRLRTQTGTTDTLQDGDAGGYVRYTSAVPVTSTVPPNSTNPWPTMTCISIRQVGAGVVTIAGGAGVTVNARAGGSLVLSGPGDLVQLLKVGTDEWDMI